MSNTTTYSTIDDAHASIVEALGEYADQYDTQAIAEHVFKWVQPTTDDGDVWLNGCGYQAKPEYADDNDENEFWDMIENFAIDTQDEEDETEPQDEPAPQLQNPFLDMMNAQILPDQK